MRNRTTLVLLAGLCIAGSGTGWAATGQEPETLAQANHDLAGRRARLDLAGGRTVPEARRVSLQAAFTDFRVDGRPERVPTTEVLRITVLSERKTTRRMWEGCALGAVVGTAAGAAAGSSRGGHSSYVGPSSGGYVAAGAVVGALAGLGLGALAGRLHELPEAVVYQGAGSVALPAARAAPERSEPGEELAAERNQQLKAMLRGSGPGGAPRPD